MSFIVLFKDEKDASRRYEPAKEILIHPSHSSQKHHLLDFVLKAEVLLNKSSISKFKQFARRI